MKSLPRLRRGRRSSTRVWHLNSSLVTCSLLAAARSSWKDVPGIEAGVVTGDVAWALLKHAKANGYAIPAFNCTSTSTCNAVLEAAKSLDRPIMIQFSEGGAAFFAGRALDNTQKQASVLGAVAGAHFVRMVSPSYGIPVLLHSDHCVKQQLPWLDGMLLANEEFFAINGEPLFSSHGLDLSQESTEENLSTCAEYLNKMAPMKLILELEMAISADAPSGAQAEIQAAHERLSPISPMLAIAVKVRPEMLASFQKHGVESMKMPGPLPFFFACHGGTSSTKEDVALMLAGGVVKMSMDMETSAVAGTDALRQAEESMVVRVKDSCTELNNLN